MHVLCINFLICVVMLFLRTSVGQVETSTGLESVAYYSAWIEIGHPVNSTELLEILFDISWDQCVKECKGRSGCDYINFHVHTHLCYILVLIDRNVGVHINNVPGYMYAKKTELDMVGYEDCYVCRSGEVCDNTVDPVACHVTNCGSPAVQDDVQVIGNMYNLDSSVLLQCRDVSLSQMMSTMTCTSTGNWTDTNITCSLGAVTTPSAANFTCHHFTNVYRTITLTDGTTLTYRVSTSPPLPQILARTTCGVEGGNLIRVTTLARMEFILEITRCSGFPSGDLWIDGDYDPNTGTWPTWDGSTIPLTGEFWAPGMPDSTSLEHCVRLDKANSYYFNDFLCEEPMNFICEKLVI